MTNMVDYKAYRRTGVIYAAPVSEHDHKTLQTVTGMMQSDAYVCLSPENPSNKWFVSKSDFERNYEEVE